MYRWILSLLALLGCSGLAAQAQQIPQLDQYTTTHAGTHGIQHFNVAPDGTTSP